MAQTLTECLSGILRSDMAVGIIGLGAFGARVRDIAAAMGCRTLVCDPPRSMDDIEELDGVFQQIWGNGMGGCQLDNTGLETYLPMTCLTAADVIAVQVPLTTAGRWPTAGIVSREFLAACKPDVRILCFSDSRVIAPELAGDSRICQMAVTP